MKRSRNEHSCIHCWNCPEQKKPDHKLILEFDNIYIFFSGATEEMMDKENQMMTERLSTKVNMLNQVISTYLQ